MLRVSTPQRIPPTMHPAGLIARPPPDRPTHCERIPLPKNLRIHTSPRVEELFEVLCADVEVSGVDPLDAQPIVVPSQGMARWLQLRWVRRWGIAAGFDYLFPGQWIRRLGRELGVDPRAGAEGEDPVDTPALSLRIFDLLPEVAARFTSLSDYLGQDPDGRRHQQLAARLAKYFGEWQLFRPEVLVEWAAGRCCPELEGRYPHEEWVSHLWMLLGAAPVEGMPLGSLLIEVRDRLRRSTLPPLSAVRVFGVNSLPPLVVQLLRGVADHQEVSIYFSCPTRHYWTGLRSQRQARRDVLRRGEEPAAALGEGPNLLANFGAQGRDFFALLSAIDDHGAAWNAVGEEDLPTTSVLRRVQAQVIELTDHRDRVAQLEPGDDSLLLHGCHSPRRELEVLRDRLWQVFAQDPDLQPCDVLVLVPDMRRYAPFVRTVFEESVEGAPPIPFSLADRRWEDEEPLLRSLLRILDLAPRRRTSLQVLDLLDTPALARRQGLDEAMILRARELVRELGIRWGSDPEQRAQDWQLPAFAGVSWREGLDAGLWGALSGELDGVVAGTAPAGELSFSTLEVTARLSRFVRGLFDLWEDMKESRRLSSWCRRMERLLDEFYLAESDGETEVLAQLRRAFEDLAQRAEDWDLREEWSAVAFVAMLRERLESNAPTLGFLSGAVTFAEMRPLRSVPFEFIAVLGLDDGVFPRLETRDSLDLVALERRIGDRSPRQDDRYLFLETLMAARKRLHLSAVSRSERDGSDCGRSLVLEELADVLRQIFGHAAEALELRHHLHGFHPAYFSEEGGDSAPSLWSSHDTRAATAATIVRGPRTELPEFWEGCELDVELPTEVDFEDLLRFWKDPAKWFCRHVLRLHFHGEGEAAEEETLQLDGLAKWRARDLVLHSKRVPPSEREWRALHRRLGLPATEILRSEVDRAIVDATEVRTWWEATGPHEERRLRLEVGGRVVLSGTLRGCNSSGVHSLSASRHCMAHDLTSLLGLVALAGSDPEGADSVLQAHHRCADTEIRMEVNQSSFKELEEWLHNMVEVYRLAHRRPVYLVHEVAETMISRRDFDLGESLSAERVEEFLGSSAGRKCWTGDRFQPGVLGREQWSVLLGPAGRPVRFIEDLGRYFDLIYRPVIECRRRGVEAGA